MAKRVTRLGGLLAAYQRDPAAAASWDFLLYLVSMPFCTTAVAHCCTSIIDSFWPGASPKEPVLDRH